LNFTRRGRRVPEFGCRESPLPRPHEDLTHHTLVDHRRGGPPIAFAAQSWCAIEIARITPERIDAALSAYETLIEQARASSLKTGSAAVLRTVDRRRVVTLLEVDGHDGFRRLASAWNDHHVSAGHRSVAESSALALYQVTASTGDDALDPGSRDAYAFEHVSCTPDVAGRLLASVTSAAGFRGMLIFGRSDGLATALVYRFEHFGQIDVFRAEAGVLDILAAAGDSFAMAYPVKTFV
jgi:hypothetical protein